MITIERPHGGDLAREVWRFAATSRGGYGHDGIRLVLAFYALQRRPSRRHGWRDVPVREDRPNGPARRWDRSRLRDCGIAEADVPRPADVAIEAIEIASRLITVEWPER